MTLLQGCILLCMAVLGGTMNAVAGGGTFFTFPTLLVTGVPVINANATSTIALWPGTVASTAAYRDTLAGQRRMLLVLGGASVLGGVLGAYVLLHTPPDVFERMLAFLMLAATLLFAYGRGLAPWLQKRVANVSGPSWLSTVGLGGLQFVIAAYGGFFGGGIGILMLALFTVLGMENIHTMNGMKTLLASCINGVAIMTFIAAHAIFWAQALVMVAGAVAGGYGGAYLARRIDPKLVRSFVTVVGFSLSLYFLLHYTLHVI